jgi:hypothetical protein
MYHKDLAALDRLELLPRVIHDFDQVNPNFTALGADLAGPLWAEAPANWLGRITSRSEDALGSIYLAPPYKMKRLMPLMRQMQDYGVIAAGSRAFGIKICRRAAVCDCRHPRSPRC